MELERFDDVLAYPSYPNEEVDSDTSPRLGVPSLDLQSGNSFRDLIQLFESTRESQEMELHVGGEKYFLRIYEGHPPERMVYVCIFDQEGERLAATSETDFHRDLFVKSNKMFGHFATKVESCLRGTGAAALVRTVFEAIFEVLPTEQSDDFSLAWFFIKMGYVPFREFSEDGGSFRDYTEEDLPRLINLAIRCRKGEEDALREFPGVQLVYQPEVAFIVWQRIVQGSNTEA